MKILQVNAHDFDGGAARAAFRINAALRSQGIDSQLVVAQQRVVSEGVTRPLSRGTLKQEIKRRISARIETLQRTSNAGSHSLNLFDSGLADWINESDADVVNLHWLGEETLSINEIARIRKPLCWTMHDMWPFSGAEHYDDLESPARYEQGYRASTRPAGYAGPDLDAWVWRRKRRSWADQRFHLISPSRWLAGCAERSALFAGQPCEVIPNPVDLQRFRPLDRHQARALLGIPVDRRYILFGAMSSTTDPRKGFHLLGPALRRLASDTAIAADTELLVFGSGAPRKPVDFGLPTRYLGHLYDELSLGIVYAAADVFAIPSLQDNLPNTLVESLACGTPCVAFDVGGMGDLIVDGVSGQLVAPFDPEAFASALAQVLRLPGSRFRASCRALAEQECSFAIVAARYATLYRRVCMQAQTAI